MKPLLTLDFDGVLHSYTSGWKGARIIPDPPVPGALEFIVTALDRFRVAIHSSRSHQWGGRRAMKQWLRRELVILKDDHGNVPQWWGNRIMRSAFADPWEDEVRHAAYLVVKQIKWPLFKPPSMVSIDDRCITFTGEWPGFDELNRFKPWNKR
jgi:hypothetical protein